MNQSKEANKDVIDLIDELQYLNSQAIGILRMTAVGRNESSYENKGLSDALWAVIDMLYSMDKISDKMAERVYHGRKPNMGAKTSSE